MPKTYSEAESVEILAKALIPSYHPELVTARLKYVFVDKASMKSGRPVLGKAKKLTGISEFLIDADFVVEVASDQWSELLENQRMALVDHLLERCTGEEDEQTGEMGWIVREPDVQEFTTILRRHGAWNTDLVAFASVAKSIDIEEMIEEVGLSEAESESTLAN